MKNEKLLLALNHIDDEFIREADPKKAKKPFNWLKFTVIAASVTILLTALNLWLFIPYETGAPDVSQYADSEYYPLIQKLNEYYYLQNYDKNAPKNNFEMLTAMLNDWDRSNTGAAETRPAVSVRPGAPDGSSDQQYEEVTDNQVEGVIEADLMKRSDRYIYYLHNGTLSVYSIAGNESRLVSEYVCTLKDASYNPWYDYSELYLSTDCKTVTVILPYTTPRNGCAVLSLDVTDPMKVTLKNEVYLNYFYQSSRLVDGEILLIGEYVIGKTPDFGDATTFVPQIESDNETLCIPMDGIVSPDTLTSARYTVVCKLDENTLALKGSAAFLSYSQEVYVSRENVYASRSYTDSVIKDNVTTATRMTEIACLSYGGESLDYVGSVSVAGTVKDQYSMDEYDGLLRVVTTTSVQKFAESNDGETASIAFLQSDTNASLYCIDLSTWEVVAEVKDFAPDGETVQSVRFDGDAAYVCTAVVVTLSDPVFFFDLSDVNNITYKDTGTIEGFSTSLISFGDGYLIGIGVNDNGSGVKLEVYEEAEDGVKSVCSYVIENANYSTDYKSYLIDRENLLIGLGVDEDPTFLRYDTNYYLFQYEEGALKLISKRAIMEDIQRARAFYEDGYLYICSVTYDQFAWFEAIPITSDTAE